METEHLDKMRERLRVFANLGANLFLILSGLLIVYEGVQYFRNYEVFNSHVVIGSLVILSTSLGLKTGSKIGSQRKL